MTSAAFVKKMTIKLFFLLAAPIFVVREYTLMTVKFSWLVIERLLGVGLTRQVDNVLGCKCEVDILLDYSN